MRAAATKTRLGLNALAAAAAILLAAGAADADVNAKGNLFISVSGSLSPSALPRRTLAPVDVRIGGKIKTFDRAKPPQLQRLSIAINRHGRLDPAGLPDCRPSQIDFLSSRGALKVCGPALVGHGSFEAAVDVSADSPFPSRGRLLAFNSTSGGRPVMLAHIYGTQPAPTTRLLTFFVRRVGGTFGTTLTATIPDGSNWGYVTGLDLALGRRFTYRGRPRSYLSAGCAAPAGFPRAAFPLARTTMAFDDGRSLSSTLIRDCRVLGE